MEGWTFGEGFYFAFITLSTIGFGDYVVGEYTEQTSTNEAERQLQPPVLDGNALYVLRQSLCYLSTYRPNVWDKLARSNKGLSILLGTGPGKEYISVYRSLAGIWIIFALAWLALILNMGARIMEHVMGLTHPGFKKQEENEGVSSSELQ